MKSAQGAELYRYEEKYATHVVGPCEPGRARVLVDTTLERLQHGRSSSLPAFPKPDLAKSADELPAVTQDRYEQLRAADLPVLWHLTHYEHWRWIVYDPQSSKAVVILEGGSWH